MSNYTKTTNFTAKDALTTGDPNKVIKGSEHDTEFDNIATAVATKANKTISGTTNGILVQTAGGDLADGILTLPTGAVVGISDTQTLTNKTLDTCTIDVDDSTVTNIADAEIKSAAAINATKIANGSVTNTEFQYINTLSSNAQTQITGKMTGSNNLSDVSSASTSRTNLGLGSLSTLSSVNESTIDSNSIFMSELNTAIGAYDSVSLASSGTFTTEGYYSFSSFTAGALTYQAYIDGTWKDIKTIVTDGGVEDLLWIISGSFRVHCVAGFRTLYYQKFMG